MVHTRHTWLAACFAVQARCLVRYRIRQRSAVQANTDLIVEQTEDIRGFDNDRVHSAVTFTCQTGQRGEQCVFWLMHPVVHSGGMVAGLAGAPEDGTLC